MITPLGRSKPAGVFNAVREGSRKVRGPTEIHEERYFFVVVRSCEDGAVSPGSDSMAFADLPHSLDLALDDLGLADVPACVEAPRDERKSLLGDRFGVREIRRDPANREGPRGRRVQVSAFLVDARVVELRPGAANALFVDLELLPRLRMRAVPHRDDVLAHRGLAGERDAGRGVSCGGARTDFEEARLEAWEDVHRCRIRAPDVVLQKHGTVF